MLCFRPTGPLSATVHVVKVAADPSASGSQGSRSGGGAPNGMAVETEAEQPGASALSTSTAGTAGVAPGAGQLGAGGVWLAMSELLDEADKQGEGQQLLLHHACLWLAVAAVLKPSGSGGRLTRLPSAAAPRSRRRGRGAAAPLPPRLCTPTHRQLAADALHTAQNVCGHRRLAGGDGLDCRSLPGAAGRGSRTV